MATTIAIIKEISRTICPVEYSAGPKNMSFTKRTVKIVKASRIPINPINLASEPNWRLRGVSSVVISVDFSATFPNSVESPTSVILYMQCPSTTVVPRIMRFVAYVASSSKESGLVLFEIIGSPVNVDSFTESETASSNSPSAGTSSPVSSTTMSPTTMSHFGNSMMFPSRIIFTGVSSLTWFRMSNFLLASISNQKPTPVARNIAKKIPMVSTNSL